MWKFGSKDVHEIAAAYIEVPVIPTDREDAKSFVDAPETVVETVAETQWKFVDNVKTVDFVLVWEKDNEEQNEQDSVDKRKTFEANLQEEGLEIEYNFVEDTGLYFVKIHTPIEVLRRYTEILRMKMPMKNIKTLYGSTLYREKKSLWNCLVTQHICVNSSVFPEYDHKFTVVYSRDKEYLFDWTSPSFFAPYLKARIVEFILDRTFFTKTDSNDKFSFGIKALIPSVYTAAYPLHDGSLHIPGSKRYNLYHHWASMRKWYRYQPVHHIRHYFGVKIALYFTWLGFYTSMLIPPALVGILCLLYSVFFIPDDIPTQDVCSSGNDIKMCPVCDECKFWNLSDTCHFSKVKHILDNYTSVIFATFMSIWAVVFLELWVRYFAQITYLWDLTGFDTEEELPRAQFIAQLARFKYKGSEMPNVNIVSGTLDFKVPYWKIRFPATIFSFSVILLLVSLAATAVVGVMLYRMCLSTALRVNNVSRSISKITISTTAAFLNLACIYIFNRIYKNLAKYLTEFEMARTQTEFDDSLRLKVYLLQFVNNYISIFYIAFYKGKFVGFPGKYHRIFGYRQEQCGPYGCFMELTIQLAIIMIGKEAINSFIELFRPLMIRWWAIIRKKPGSIGFRPNQWEEDYKLLEWGNQSLMPEYLHVLLQYGFVTIFVSAFPLIPLFALLKNIFEIRIDATKLLKYHRRPVAQRVPDMGVWFTILKFVSRMAVITNGLIIAFTSELIPRMVYKIFISQNNTLTGYMNYSLSYMDVNDLDTSHKPNTNISFCRYRDSREPPWSDNKYQLTGMFWFEQTARLVFVVLFENLVVAIVVLIQWIIPKTPATLREKMRREKYLINEIIIYQERLRAKKKYWS